ncbi:hypothetical protein ACH5RR_026151 [Cinchona calisaya]|uniref:Reverse transcriptase zinc-binding domain-containing protein n=1 Tax=Cinchona calisaya TaxID=153742 RepID=A0ABD2Z1Q1_9GENT
MCMGADETVDHLFFFCPYSHYLWSSIQQSCRLFRTQQTLKDELLWFANHLNCNSFHTHLCKMAGEVYHLRRERNKRQFQHKQQPANVLVSTIQKEIRHIVSSRRKVPNTKLGKSPIWSLNFFTLANIVPHLLF